MHPGDDTSHWFCLWIVMYLLVKQVVVHFDLTVGFKVIWHQHYWYRHVT